MGRKVSSHQESHSWKVSEQGYDSFVLWTRSRKVSVCRHSGGLRGPEAGKVLIRAALPVPKDSETGTGFVGFCVMPISISEVDSLCPSLVSCRADENPEKGQFRAYSFLLH